MRKREEGSPGKPEGGPTLPFGEVVPEPKSTLSHPPGQPRAVSMPEGTEAGRPPPRFAGVLIKQPPSRAAPHSCRNISTK